MGCSTLPRSMRGFALTYALNCIVLARKGRRYSFRIIVPVFALLVCTLFNIFSWSVTQFRKMYPLCVIIKIMYNAVKVPQNAMIWLVERVEGLSIPHVHEFSARGSLREFVNASIIR